MFNFFKKKVNDLFFVVYVVKYGDKVDLFTEVFADYKEALDFYKGMYSDLKDILVNISIYQGDMIKFLKLKE